MVKGTVRVSRSGNGLQPLVDRLKALSKKEVYVGIPQEKASRPAGGDPINNAELLYIHTHGVRSQDMRQEMEEKTKQGMKYSAAHSLYVQSHGSPVWAIPPRPVLEPAIEDSKDVIGKKWQWRQKLLLMEMHRGQNATWNWLVWRLRMRQGHGLRTPRTDGRPTLQKRYA